MVENLMGIISDNNYLKFMTYLGVVIFLITLLYYGFLIVQMNKFRNLLVTIANKENSVHHRIYLINENVKKRKLKDWVVFQPWNSFYKEYSYKDTEYVPDPLFYFNESNIVYKIGFRKLIEVVPPVFVSLGILGTFWGITTGINDIDSGAGVEGLQEGINTLLSGMKFAFYSSIAGIIISLFYQIIDLLFFYKGLSISTEKLLKTLNEVIPIETEINLLDQLVTTQEAHFNDMKEFYTDQFIPQLTAGISESVSSTINPHLEKSNLILEKVSQTTVDSQSAVLDEMVAHFIESLNQVTGDHINNLGEALHKTIEWQEKVFNEMSSLVEELSNAAEGQSIMAQTTIDLNEKLNDWSMQSTELLEEVANNNSMSESIQTHLEHIYSNITDERETLNKMQLKYSETLNHNVQSLNQLWQNNQELLEQNKRRFSDLNSHLNESMKLFADHMHRGVQGTFEQFDVELKNAIEYIER